MSKILIFESRENVGDACHFYQIYFWNIILFCQMLYQCCRNEHEQMNIDKQPPNINQELTPAALFVRERSSTVCPFNSSHRNIFSVFFFFFQQHLQKKQKEAEQANIIVRKSCQFALTWQAGRSKSQVKYKKIKQK